MNSKQLLPVTITQTNEEFKIAQLNYFNMPIDVISANIKKPINPFDDTYFALCERVLNFGTKSPDRTGVGTLSVFGEHLKFDLRLGFPILTTKKINIRHAINEFLFLYSNKCEKLDNLPKESRFLWEPWADNDGNLGKIYGMNVRKWEYFSDSSVQYIDQLNSLIKTIKNNPDSRRHVITNWKVDELANMSLVPCHGNIVQFYVRNGELSCQMYQRSADICIGLPFNMIHYALFTHIIAALAGLKVGDLSICLGDAHIYLNHIAGIKEQLGRTGFTPPQLKILNSHSSFDNFKVDDFELINYSSHPFIKFEIAI